LGCGIIFLAWARDFGEMDEREAIRVATNLGSLVPVVLHPGRVYSVIMPREAPSPGFPRGPCPENG